MKLLAILLFLFSFIFGKSYENLLALSWQNGFCAVNHHKKSCKKISLYAQNNFVLHGLWPQPRSNVNCPGIKHFRLPDELFQKLKVVMPGVKDRLHFHEWRKHGTCYSKSPEIYFKDSIKLVEEFNHSKFRDWFVKHKGEIVTKEQISYAFNKSFKYQSRKMIIKCKKGYITEIRINLKGDPEKEDLYTLMKNASPIHQKSCQRGMIAE